MKIGILLFADVDLLDVGGPYEVLLTASRLVERDGGEPPFEVVTVAQTDGPVSAYGGLRLLPHVSIEQAGELDIVLVPGAIAIDDVLASTGLLTALSRLIEPAELVGSVCTGAFLLGALGLLEDREWTTHWEDLAILAERLGARGTHGVRWVDAGQVVTAGGLSSGIAMALHLVDRFCGRQLAQRTATQLEYAWDPQGHDRVEPATDSEPRLS